MAAKRGAGFVVRQGKFEQDIRGKTAGFGPWPWVRSLVANAVAGISSLGDTGRVQGGFGQTVGPDSGDCG